MDAQKIFGPLHGKEGQVGHDLHRAETRNDNSASTRSLSTRSESSHSSSSLSRRVYFEVDDEDCIIAKKMPYTYYNVEDDETADCQEEEEYVSWLSDSEMGTIRKQAALVAKFCIQCRPDYGETGMMLLTHCNSQATDAISMDAITAFVGGSARGLEQSVFPMLQKRHKQTVHTTLQLQSRLKGLPEERRWHLIAQHYKRTSRYASLWSHVLALGDARLQLAEEGL